MPATVVFPRVMQAAGRPPKLIEEYIGRLATATSAVSVARMVSPEGRCEPAQTPEFDEYSVVVRGELHAESDGGTVVAHAGESVVVPRGVRVRYSTPASGGAEYVAVCLPAFGPELAHREPPLETRAEPATASDETTAQVRRWEDPVPDPRLVEAYDDLAVWSAPFGLTLLEVVPMRRGIRALDVGCGTGFPLVELAQRLGPDSEVLGLDPWASALARARFKLDVWGVRNVRLIEGRAESIPLEDQSLDLVVSNNGLNNVDDLGRALAECARVLRAGARLVFTFNLPKSMWEVYETLEQVLKDQGRGDAIPRMYEHIHEKRKTVAWMRERVEQAGFRHCEVTEHSFRWRFSGADALFEHGLFRLAFVSAWLGLVRPDERASVFDELALRLEARAAAAGELSLTIPYACFDCAR
jgi:arsenite methyltransferase